MKLNQNFSPRQQQVLDYLLEGLTGKEIAKRVGVSESAVKKRIRTVLEKTGKPSRMALLASAIRELAMISQQKELKRCHAKR